MLKFDLQYSNSGKTVDLSQLIPHQLRKSIDPDESFAYTYSNDTLFIRNGKNVYLFQNAKHEFVYLRHYGLRNKFPTEHLYYRNGSLYFFGIYNENPASEHLSSGFLKLDLKDSTEQIITVQFSYLPMTHFGPNNFMDMYDSTYMVCDPILYRIRFYNLNHQLCDSIIAPDSLFTCSSPMQFQSQFNTREISSNPSPHLPEIADYLAKIDRVWTVHFLDDHTIFVRLSRNSLNKNAEDAQRLYDHVWKKINGGWRLILVKDIGHLETSSIITTKTDLWPFFVPGSEFYFQNGCLYHAFWSSSGGGFPQSVGEFYGASETERSKLVLKVVTYRFDHP